MNNNYKVFIKKENSFDVITRIGRIILLLSIIVFIISAFALFFEATPFYVSSIMEYSLFFIILGIILTTNEWTGTNSKQVFVEKDNKLYVYNIDFNNFDELKPYMLAQGVGNPSSFSAIVGIFSLFNYRKKANSIYSYMENINFDQNYFLNNETEIVGVEIVKETPNYLKINARFENQSRKEIIIYNYYNDYQDLINLVKSLGGK